MKTAVSELPALRQTVKELSQISTLRAVYHLAEVWGVIGLAIWLSGWVCPPFTGIWGACVYIGAVVVIAARQHALMVLVHEAIHKRIARTVWINDALARVAAAFPVFISLSKWRFIHLHHHQYTQTKDDPDRAIYAVIPWQPPVLAASQPRCVWSERHLDAEIFYRSAFCDAGF